jgi:hypothetical protein
MATVSDPSAPAGVVEPVVPAGASLADASADLAVAGWQSGGEAESKSDRYLARRLAAAGADFKGVALTTFVLGAAVCGGAWLVLGILVEHWLVPGGLSPSLRWAWLGVAALALVAAAIRWLVPLVRYRVNLVYAARAIEREHPELHNDLVNTVLVKAHPESNPAKVVRSLERRTAKQLADVPVEAVIDRTVPLRLAYVLAALVGLAGLYELAAPKSLLVSAARLLAPWVGWAAPSRVRIEPPRLAWRMPAEQGPLDEALDRRRIAVEAGSATLVRGRQLVVAADIRGLRRDEKPVVVVAPLRGDGAVDAAAAAWRTELGRGQTVGGAQRLFTAILPDAARGLDHAVEITLEAGDARTAPIRVAVVDSPTLLVREIRYAFPAYTRRPPETVAWQGDIRAVEGTEVTIVAESNQPLEDAWIDFDGDGTRDLRFAKSAADLARVTKSFSLRLDSDGVKPEHASYRLLFQPKSAADAGREAVITDAMEHRIEVLADVAPEVAIEEPRESPLRVPPAAPVTVRVQAHDPDFALARVTVETRLQGGAAGPEVVVLDAEQSGMFRGTAQLVPERLGAGPGATLEYRAVATDNRPKRPNVAHSPWQALRIDPAAPPRQPEQPPAGRKQSDDGRSQGEAGADGQPGASGQSGEKKQPGDGGNDQRSGGDDPRSKDKPQNQSGDDQRATPQPKQSSDGKQPGKEDGQQQGAQNGDQQQPQDGKQPGDQKGQGKNQGQGAEQGQGLGAEGQRQGGQEQESGKPQSGGKQSGGKQPGSERDAGGKAGGAKPGASGGQQADGDAGQQGGGKQGQRGDARGKAVAADGTNDGEAMERILEHRREQGGKDGGENGESVGQEADGGNDGQGKKPEQGQGKEGQGKEGDAKQKGQGSGERPDGATQPGAEGEHEHTPCAAADGKPCGKEGCPTCKGQGGAQAGEGSGAGGEKQGAQSGKQGSGKQGAGEKGAGQAAGEGQGQGEGQEAGGTSQAAGKPGNQAADGKPSGAAGDKQTGGQQPGEQAAQTEKGSESQGQEQGQGAGGRQGQGAGGKQGEGTAAAQKPGDAQPSASGQPGSGAGETGSGGWAGGDSAKRPEGQPLPDGPAPSKETEWGEQNLTNARNATNLALDYLRKAVESGDTAVLDRLGWTADEARAFLDRWQKMRQLAESADPVERGQFEQTMRSLGLRPDGVKSSRDVPSDARGGQAEGRRSRPPADYQEQFKAYTQGTSGE